MTPEEIMHPRFTVISDYPFNNHFRENDIVILNQKDEEGFFVKQPALNNKPNFGSFCAMREDYFRKYRAVFKRLEWWQHRSKQDLLSVPYVKATGAMYQHEVHKLTDVSGVGAIDHFLSAGQYYRELRYFEPATKEDYENYLSKNFDINI